MSRSNPNEGAKNPSKRFFEWAGSVGHVKYYDRETKENVFIDPKETPFLFLVLDQLSTVTGFSDALQTGYYANEVRSTQTDKIVVRSKKGIEFEGLYAKKDLPQGAKFAASVYIAYKDENGVLQLGNIKFAGAAISSWIEFVKTVNVNKVAIAITGSVHGKKGTVEFESPTFQAVQVDEETDKAAVEIDRELQAYLTEYLKSARAQNTQVRAEDYPADDPNGVVAAVEAAGEPQVAIKDLDAPKAEEAPVAAPVAPAAPAAPAPQKLDLEKIKF